MANDPAVKAMDSMEEVWEAFRPELNEVEVQIEKHLHSHAPLINTVADHILSSGGKRIRPLLFILSARLFSYPEKEFLLLGSLVEFIHTATLLHDDVLDEADIRRGKKNGPMRVGQPCQHSGWRLPLLASHGAHRLVSQP